MISQGHTALNGNSECVLTCRYRASTDCAAVVGSFSKEPLTGRAQGHGRVAERNL